MTALLAFAAGFALALIPVWLHVRDVHGYVEWETPWRLWRSGIGDALSPRFWRRRGRTWR